MKRLIPPFLCLLILLSGCTYDSFYENPRALARRIAEAGGFEGTSVDSLPFRLQTFLRKSDHTGNVLRVYIEGDGKAWKNSYSPPSDPTPDDPIALHLAIADHSGPSIAYIGRPCQYLGLQELKGCWPEYWTRARFAPEVVVSVSGAIDKLKSRYGNDDIELIGFSGGGVLATLVAAYRNDVHLLITIAAPLDLDAWTKHHQVSSLSGSLKPLQADRGKLQSIQQYHFTGSDDDIVPAGLMVMYIDKLGNPPAANIIALEGYSHSCCWVQHWGALLYGINVRHQNLWAG